MSSTTRSKRLSISSGGGAGVTTLYIVPAATVTLVKFASISNQSGATVVVQFVVLDGTSGNFAVWFTNNALAPFTAAGGVTWFVMQTGDKLNVSTTSGSWSALVAGAELPAG